MFIGYFGSAIRSLITRSSTKLTLEALHSKKVQRQKLRQVEASHKHYERRLLFLAASINLLVL